MSNPDKSEAEIAFEWWKKNIHPRETSSRARSLSARLRRASGAAVICEPEVYDLAKKLKFGVHKNAVLVRLVNLLAFVREDDVRPLAKIASSSSNVLSPARFERLMRADEAGAVDSIRRALIGSGNRCNVRRLAGDIIYWNDRTKARWCFDYFGEKSSDS